MKKSIIDKENKDSVETEPTQAPRSQHPIVEILLSEGGFSLLFILPIVVYFYFWAAMPPI